MFFRYSIFSVISLYVFGFLLIIFATDYAQAKTYTAKSGKTEVLTAISQYDADSCGSMKPPKYNITQTSHGKLEVETHRLKLEKGPCIGRTIKFYFLIYTSKRGYRGNDRGAISYNSSQFTDSTINSYRKLDIIINVK